MQGDCTSLSTAVDGWYDLTESPYMEFFKNVIQKIMSSAIEPFFIVAYLMDPFFMGKPYYCFNNLLSLIILYLLFNINNLKNVFKNYKFILFYICIYDLLHY